MQFLQELPTLTLILLIVFLISFLIQIFYYWFFYSRLAFYKSRPGSDTLQPVSVVIASHNDGIKLKRNLPAILTQDYPDFEVIVVNDASDDNTEEVLTAYSQQYPRLKAVHIKQSVIFFRSKKFPLSVGIKSAKNEILLLTDADCYPASDQWIREMQAAYDKNSEIILGFSPYEKQPGLLNLLIRFDTFQIATLYFSFALARLPYMGVGRNLSYKKSLFFRHNGFISHYKIQSGDDDLFIKSAATKTNTRIRIIEEAHVISEPKKTFKAWIRQKRRHFSTGSYYKPLKKNLLGLQALSGLLYYCSLITLICFKIFLPVILGIHGFRLLNRIILLGFCSKKLNQGYLFLFSPVSDPFFTFFNPLLVLWGMAFKIKRW
ncbi:MAG: glycosyltransferase [Bacteroidales bacterium]